MSLADKRIVLYFFIGLVSHGPVLSDPAFAVSDSVHVASDPSHGLFYGSDLQLWSDGFGSLTMQGYNKSGINKPSQSSLHLQVPNSTVLPKDTLAELVLQRTSGSQAFGEDYGRWSFTTFGSDLNNTSGVYGEFGGIYKPSDFVFNMTFNNTLDQRQLFFPVNDN